jgi:hypothetical protein
VSDLYINSATKSVFMRLFTIKKDTEDDLINVKGDVYNSIWRHKCKGKVVPGLN